jgi:small subunit ribosomal protein S16
MIVMAGGEGKPCPCGKFYKAASVPQPAPGCKPVCPTCCKVPKTVIIVVFFRVRTYFYEKIMVVIRLSRGGSKKRPFYNIVATDSRNRRDGRFIERIGFYNPIASGAAEGFSIKQDRLTHWQGVGAQLSPTVERLVKAAAKKAA